MTTEHPTGPTSDPEDVPSDGDDASTHPGGEPSGNPLDPVVRPGVDISQAPHTGSRPPAPVDSTPHDAVAAPGTVAPDQGAADHGAAAPGGTSTDPSSGRTTPDAEPSDTAGLEPGGGVAPGDTPPASGGTATSLATNEHEPGGRSRLLVPISILVVLAVLVAAFFVGQLLDFF